MMGYRIVIITNDCNKLDGNAENLKLVISFYLAYWVDTGNEGNILTS